MIDLKKYSSDLMPSLVVFLVALPLCMGIAVACGVPAEKGLITGIVGGLLVGFISGSPMQVSGPAAGLIVIVWDIVQKYGLEGLGIAVFCAGLLQLVAGCFGLALWFRAVSPAVIRGMLSGIGIIIIASQFHIMIDDVPKGSVIQNLMTIPEGLIKIFDPGLSSSHTYAGIIGLMTIAVVFLWNKFKPTFLRFIPGALTGVVFAAIAVFTAKLDVKFIEIPENLISNVFTFNWLAYDYSSVASLSFFVMVLALALVASAETLLCAVAVDRMHKGPKTRFNKELISQGVGNMVCGVFAALPMTGVIVRSSANVDAGAKTRASAILHGLWLLVLIAFLPQVLKLIPTSSLAALLVYIGFRLVNYKEIIAIKNKNNQEFVILVATIASIVCFSLLTGILIGLGVAIFQLAIKMTRLEIELHKNIDGEYELDLIGSATFLRLPLIARTLESLPDDAVLHVHLKDLDYIDRACLELIVDWEDNHSSAGGRVLMEWDELHHSHRKSEPQKKINPKKLKIAS